MSWIKNIERKIVSVFDIRINARMFILNIVCLVGIFILGVNIFRVVSLGVQRHQLIQDQSIALKDVLNQQEELEQNLEWYSSLEYVEMQSRDFLNLGNEEESILVIPETIETQVAGSGLERDSAAIHAVEPSINSWLDLFR